MIEFQCGSPKQETTRLSCALGSCGANIYGRKADLEGRSPLASYDSILLWGILCMLVQLPPPLPPPPFLSLHYRFTEKGGGSSSSSSRRLTTLVTNQGLQWAHPFFLCIFTTSLGFLLFLLLLLVLTRTSRQAGLLQPFFCILLCHFILFSGIFSSRSSAYICSCTFGILASSVLPPNMFSGGFFFFFILYLVVPVVDNKCIDF